MAASIAHYATLVNELQSEHRLLLEAYGQLKKSADASDGPAFRQAVQDFKALLVPHLVKEAFKVYTYLRQRSKDRGETAVYDKVTAYKTEMTGIGDAAMRFIDTYAEMPDADIDFPQVQESLRQIGQLLGDRIRREEAELYPLYQSTH